MIRVGIVGLGFMGRMHYRCWKAQPGATIAAICESNPKVLAAAGEAPKGNVEGAADHIDLTVGECVHRPRRAAGFQVGRCPVDHLAHIPASGDDGAGARGRGARALREADGLARGRVRPHDRRGAESRQGASDWPLHPVLARVRRDARADPERTVWTDRGGVVPPVLVDSDLEPRQLVRRREAERRPAARSPYS